MELTEKSSRAEDSFSKELLGTKAYNLTIMQQNGLRIPQFICIPANELTVGIDWNAKSYETQLRENIAAALAKHFYLKIPSKLYSVRSSSTAEDGDTTSFAGQFDTYLDVEEKDIPTYVEKCVYSLRSDSVMAYCKGHNLDCNQIQMSVIIQEMIHPDCSGILFTSNPQGILNESVIVTGCGVGQNVVEDLVDTTTYYYNRTDRNYYYETKGNSAVLESACIEELIAISERVSELFGGQMDMEFAVKDGQIYVLQARKITTVDETHPLIMDNSNIVESYPGISLPLTASFVNVVYSGVFRGVAHRCVKSKKVLDRYAQTFRQMVGCVNGRMYYKISNWYTVIKFLPFNRKIIPIWQDMLGVSNKNYNAEKVQIGFFGSLGSYFFIIKELLTVGKSMNRLEKEFAEVEAFYRERFREDMSNEELLQLYDAIKERLLAKWDVTLLNDMYAFIYTGLLKSTLKKCGLADYEHVTNEYISGITNIESMKPVRALLLLAVLYCEGKFATPSQAMEDAAFREHFEQYIARYGDRSMEELKLETKTFRTDANLLWEKILSYAEDEERLRNMIQAMMKEADADTVTDTSLSGVPKRKQRSVRRLGRHAMKGIRYREVQRLNRSRIFGMVRAIYVSMGQNLAKEGRIDCREDVFYLTVEELEDCVHHSRAYQEVIGQRKQEYEVYRQIPAYSRIIFSNQEFNKTHENINSIPLQVKDGEIRGIPCSNGEAEGEVVIVTGPEDAKEVKDKIIVAKMTDPGWVFLLVNAKGIITEKGSLLSHTAIISRELKIPAVVGVKGAVSRIPEGSRVRINGNTGRIEVLDESHTV